MEGSPGYRPPSSPAGETESFLAKEELGLLGLAKEKGRARLGTVIGATLALATAGAALLSQLPIGQTLLNRLLPPPEPIKTEQEMPIINEIITQEQLLNTLQQGGNVMVALCPGDSSSTSYYYVGVEQNRIVVNVIGEENGKLKPNQIQVQLSVPVSTQRANTTGSNASIVIANTLVTNKRATELREQLHAWYLDPKTAPSPITFAGDLAPITDGK